jgi:hypothetical protein
MAGLDPAISVPTQQRTLETDRRVKPGHDVKRVAMDESVRQAVAKLLLDGPRPCALPVHHR